VIKIDVQRNEGRVLQGGRQAIARFRPIVLMECYFQDLLQLNSELLAPFKEANYKIMIPEAGSLHGFDPDSLAALQRGGNLYRDLAFVPEEKISFFS